MDDAALLHRYVNERSDEAFAELVRRHLNLVYFAALRQIPHAPHLAEDVAQTVFTLLARKAPTLTRHPALAGWLHTTAVFTARDLLRAEIHRQDRELTALHMHDLLNDPTTSAEWEKLRPAIDDALSALPTTDREAILLRFFQNRPFSEVGAALRLSEDTARMRVNRALKKLRAVLVKRGLTSTSAALATALAGQSALAAPAGLGAQISASVFTSITAVTATAGAGTAALLTLKLMAASKITTVIATAAALLAFATAANRTRQLTRARTEVSTLQSERDTLNARLTTLEKDLADSRKRVIETESDTEKLLAAADTTARLALVDSSEPSSPAPITKEFVDARYKRARELAELGRSQEALAEFLWCYDKGMPVIASFKGVRSSFLLNEIEKLGKHLPSAVDALRTRRDHAVEQMTANPRDRDAAHDFASLSSYIGEKGKVLELYDQLPADDPRRPNLLIRVYDQLVDARRYADAANAHPYSRMLRDLTLNIETTASMPATDRQLDRSYTTRTTAKNIEVLAGAGRLENALTLATQLLAFDSSEETKALLAEHLTRAGHPELLTP